MPQQSNVQQAAPEIGQPVYCVCCGQEIVAMQYPDRLVIRIRRHGQDHVGVIPRTALSHTPRETAPSS